MALIICPECGKEISDKAKVCIHCGYPLEKGTNTSKDNDKKVEFHSCAPLKIFTQNEQIISIECGNCDKVYSFNKKYFSECKDDYCVPNQSIICPNCKNGVQAGTKIKSKYRMVNKSTLSKPQSEQKKIEQKKTEQKKSRSLSVVSIIVIILLMIVGVGAMSSCSSGSTSHSYGEVRCWYCAKVIMNDGRPIHCTHDYNSVYICDYCGTSNRIK